MRKRREVYSSQCKKTHCFYLAITNILFVIRYKGLGVVSSEMNILDVEKFPSTAATVQDIDTDCVHNLIPVIKAFVVQHNLINAQGEEFYSDLERSAVIEIQKAASKNPGSVSSKNKTPHKGPVPPLQD
jgi:hypothetical protein